MAPGRIPVARSAVLFVARRLAITALNSPGQLRVELLLLLADRETAPAKSAIAIPVSRVKMLN